MPVKDVKMITEEVLRNIIGTWKTPIKSKIIERSISLDTSGDRIIVISGIRRCGKSTLLLQNFANKKNAVFINFEDPRLSGFEISDFYKIEKIANEKNAEYLIFDEIQNIPLWEQYARHAHDRGIKLFITGSNASMLSKELGTKLTGRYKQYELFPFDYHEFREFTNQEKGPDSFTEFLLKGGLPEFLKNRDPEYLRTLLNDIITRDIAVRRNIKNEHTLVKLAVNLMSNISKEFSFNKLTKILEIKSVRSTIDYCNYLQESYLIELIPAFSFSSHIRQNNPKKVYAIDTGLARANSISLSDDYGRLLENAVYLKLRKNFSDIQYFKDGKTECDFIVKQGNKITSAFQVCWQLTPENLSREINGLKNAMQQTGAENGIIITFNQEDNFDTINAIPFWKWQM